jgi:hypothetical protein
MKTQIASELLEAGRAYMDACKKLADAPGEYAEKELLDMALHCKRILFSVLNKAEGR